MAKVIVSITTSVDGYIAGPDDGPGKGLGERGERLHYWVFGGPWSYDDEPRGEPSGEALEFLNAAMARAGAIVVGRWMYEAAGHWGDKNRGTPWSSSSRIARRRSPIPVSSSSSAGSMKRSGAHARSRVTRTSPSAAVRT
jgi:hypothetical protein